jgi:hypothetical protein
MAKFKTTNAYSRRPRSWHLGLHNYEIIVIFVTCHTQGNFAKKLKGLRYDNAEKYDYDLSLDRLYKALSWLLVLVMCL